MLKVSYLLNHLKENLLHFYFLHQMHFIQLYRIEVILQLNEWKGSCRCRVVQKLEQRVH